MSTDVLYLHKPSSHLYTNVLLIQDAYSELSSTLLHNVYTILSSVLKYRSIDLMVFFVPIVTYPIDLMVLFVPIVTYPTTLYLARGYSHLHHLLVMYSTLTFISHVNNTYV